MKVICYADGTLKTGMLLSPIMHQLNVEMEDEEGQGKLPKIFEENMLF